MSNLTQFLGGIKSVQSGTVTISAGSTSGTTTITAVDTTKCSLKATRVIPVTNAGGFFTGARISLTDATTITATSVATPNSTLTVYFELTEYF